MAFTVPPVFLRAARVAGLTVERTRDNVYRVHLAGHGRTAPGPYGIIKRPAGYWIGEVHAADGTFVCFTGGSAKFADVADDLAAGLRQQTY